MSYYMKLPARIFGPLTGLLTFTNILFIISVIQFKNKNFYYIFSLTGLLAIGAFPEFTRCIGIYMKQYKEYGKVNLSIINDMNRFSNTIFIPTTIRSWEMHNATDPIHEINLLNKNCYVYLSIELSLAPETTDQLIDKFGTADHSKLFDKISKMENVVFIADEQYANFLRAYYYFLYKQGYYFERIFKENTPFYEKTGLNYYRLKKIS